MKNTSATTKKVPAQKPRAKKAKKPTQAETVAILREIRDMLAEVRDSISNLELHTLAK